MKALLKSVVAIICLWFGAWVGLKGFHMPNSAAADLCFGVWWIACFIVLMIIVT